MRRSRTAPTPVTDLPTLAILWQHPLHPMHPLLRTSSGQRRVSFTGIPMRTTRKTKEAASNEEGEPYSCIEHLRHIDSQYEPCGHKSYESMAVRVGGHTSFPLFLIKCLNENLIIFHV